VACCRAFATTALWVCKNERVGCVHLRIALFFPGGDKQQETGRRVESCCLNRLKKRLDSRKNQPIRGFGKRGKVGVSQHPLESPLIKAVSSALVVERSTRTKHPTMVLSHTLRAAVRGVSTSSMASMSLPALTQVSDSRRHSSHKYHPLFCFFFREGGRRSARSRTETRQRCR
jgi:hypothetical protein